MSFIEDTHDPLGVTKKTKEIKCKGPTNKIFKAVTMHSLRLLVQAYTTQNPHTLVGKKLTLTKIRCTNILDYHNTKKESVKNHAQANF